MSRPNRCKAFTLLEMLLVIGLIGILSGSVFAFLWQVAAQKTAVTQRAMDDQSADAVIERLETALTGAVAADSSGTAGILGTSSSVRVLSRGVTLPMKEEDRAWSAGDLQGAEFRFESGAIKARRWDAHQSRSGGVAGSDEIVSDHVGSMRLRYFDGQAWADSFNSNDAKSLPVALEISLWFGTPSAASSNSSSTEVARPADITSNPDAPSFSTAPPTMRPETAATSGSRSISRSDNIPATPPDRIRIIVVPDGPTTVWKELR